MRHCKKQCGIDTGSDEVKAETAAIQVYINVITNNRMYICLHT